MLRRLTFAVLALAALLASTPGAAALGEGADPRAVETVNAQINRLHAELAARSGEAELLEALLAAYNDRIHLLDGDDPEGMLAVDRLSDALLARDPGNVRALCNLADALLAKNRHDEAHARVMKALERAPTDARGNLLAARIHTFRLEFPAALAAASHAAAADDPRIAEQGAALIVSIRALADEWRRLDNACTAKPNALEPRLARARFMIRPEFAPRRGNVERALAEIEEIVKKNPDYTEGLLFLSEVCLKFLDQPARAEKLARTAMKTAGNADLSRLAAVALNEAAMRRAEAQKRGRGE